MQSSVGFVAGIKMKPDRNHPLQDLRAWLNVKYAGFRGPRPESFDILSRAHRDRDILMPRNSPIRLWDFVEENATDGKCPVPSTASAKSRTRADSANLLISGRSKRLRTAKILPFPEQTFSVLLPLYDVDQLIDLRLGQNAFLNSHQRRSGASWPTS